jgi:exopolyphosphatase/guanosine-5'-triphosphate,3'-diphosphate pyrophosphatase
MQLAVIDCGTNTFNLAVFSFNINKQPFRLFSTRIPVKLGENPLPQKGIAPPAFSRGLNAMASFKKELERFTCHSTIAFGTSAIRDATNAADFIQAVLDATGILIEVIDGNREAELIFKGVAAAVDLNGATNLIVDVGGGSTEFIIASGQSILWKQSFNIGAARILDTFKPSNPITSDEIEAINHYLTEMLEPLRLAMKQYKVERLIGSSGAFESVIELIAEQLSGDPFEQGKSEFIISADNYYKISDKMMKSTMAERMEMKGLVAMRVDMIVIFFIKINLLLKWFPVKQIYVSTYCLKEGAAIDYIKKI